MQVSAGKTGYIVDLGWDRIVAQTKSLGRSSVKIGLMADADTQNGDEEDASGTTYSMEELINHAIANEYGFEPMDIPSRPFMREAIDKNVEDLNIVIEGLISELNEGLITPEKMFWEIGKLIKKLIRDSIKNGNWEPNSPNTKKIVPGNKPLIDTSQMIGSMRYKTFMSRAGIKKTDGQEI